LTYYFNRIAQITREYFIDIYPINPQAFAHFRKAFAVSGAKDDSTDAQLMWDYLLNHRDRLRVWTPEDVDTRMLGLLVEDRRKMLDLRTKLSNKLTAALKGYFPQALALMGTKVASPMACDFLQRWPSLGAIKKCRDHTLEAFYTQHQVRSRMKIDARIALAPRLLVAMGTDRARFDSAEDVATFFGIAPVTERSGQHTWVHWRLACSKFLRQSFHEFANLSRHQSAWANAYYEVQRARGKSHHAALRALAFKWIRIIYHCWKQREIYDETKYLAALEKRNSPLIKFPLIRGQ
jgi:transposase